MRAFRGLGAASFWALLLLLPFLLHEAAAQSEGTCPVCPVCPGGCPTGFNGTSCSICQSDQACIDKLGNAAATCSHDVNFQPNSQLKSYSCSLTGEGLAGLLEPGSLLVQCNTGLGSNAAPAAENATAPAGGARLLLQAGSGAFCEIGFKVKSPSVQVACNATQCSIASGSATADCAVAKCNCTDGNCANDILVNGLVGAVQGPVSMSCEPGGSCKLKLSGLGLDSIAAQCDVGECLQPTQGTLGNETQSTGGSVNTDPIIAAIPSMVLVCIILFLGSYALANRRLWQYDISTADALELERLAKEAANTEPRLGALEFKHLSVSVPVPSPEVMESRLAALKAKALQRSTPDGSLLPKKDSRVSSLLKASKALVLGSSQAGPSLGDMEAAADSARKASDTEAQAAAEYVASLHTGGDDGQWYILKDLTFTARSGEVVGVIGPSGCGKTSLLGSIAGSAVDVGARAITSGLVLVDGKRRRKRDVAYVPQSDVLIPSLTVQECLRYSALLRLPEDTKPLDLQFRIESVLEELGLQHVAESQVGGSGRIRGVSGGERRRVTIGMELVTDPAILILDEPTSGLDSFTAINLVRTLRQVAARGRVVISSLHQPSRDMFLSLDQAILMSHGRMLYAGRPADAEAWFARRGLPCPEGSEIAEHMLKVASSPPDIQRLVELQGAGPLSPAVSLDRGHSAAAAGAAPAAPHSLRPSSALEAHTTAPALWAPAGQQQQQQDTSQQEDTPLVLPKGETAATEAASSAVGSPVGSQAEPDSFSFASPTVHHTPAPSPAAAASRPALEVEAGTFAAVPGAPAALAHAHSHTLGGGASKGRSAHGRGASHSTHLESEASYSLTTESELGSVTAKELDASTGGDHHSRHHSRQHRKPGWSRQLAVLFWRSWVDMVRNPTLMRLHVIIAAVMGLLTGFVFWDLQLDNVGVQNRMGGTFFAMAFFAFASLTTVDLLMNERAVVTREVRGGYYNPVLYLASKLTLDGVLLRMLPAVLYWAPFYYMAGFKTGSAYAATYVFCLIAFSGTMGAMSMTVSVAADTPGQASFLMNFLLLFSLIFTGFLVNVDSIPEALRWLHYLSVWYYTFEAMVSSEMSGLVVDFQAQGFAQIKGVLGETFLRTLGFNPDNITRNIWALIAFYGGFALLSIALFVARLPRTSRGRRARAWAAAKRRLGLGGRR